ncbi:MarR family winged helix-turn-helix transcriptional regulator [Actinophytocola sp.]|uniref:MarR family winged helix-turn-helix transcriptional regulator n=1 Tax=Actinophytocola sp. TaxID=1872138 RepID=UPI002D2ED53F|nr:MarR family transcriptional regulator [Actinophytocola sp.]HYQ69311.1 MarR family transcriptional regulator [Actinophytocola sp.]
MPKEDHAAQTGRTGDELGRDLSTAVVMFHEAVGAHLGVSAGDQRALTFISRDGAMSAGELAERTGLTPGAVTGMIDRLARAGLVHRAHDPNDRRRVLVTATGHRPDVFGDLATAMNALNSRYDEQEMRAIADYLTRMVDILREQTRRLTARR